MQRYIRAHHYLYDCFQIEAADVGPLQKIRVGHDGKGMFSGWFLDKVNI